MDIECKGCGGHYVCDPYEEEIEEGAFFPMCPYCEKELEYDAPEELTEASDETDS